MARKRKRRKISPLEVVAVILAVLVVLIGGLTAFMLFSGNGGGSDNPVTKKITQEVSKKAVEKYVESETGTDVNIKEIEESMSEEDSDTFNEIVDKYSDSGLVSDALSIYQENGGDLSAIAAELKDKIDPEDIETIKELYAKYGSSIPLE